MFADDDEKPANDENEKLKAKKSWYNWHRDTSRFCRDFGCLGIGKIPGILGGRSVNGPESSAIVYIGRPGI